MVRPPKRVTRRDLRQPDQFVTLTGKGIEFVKENRSPLLAALALTGVALAGLWGWTFYRATQDRHASEQYSRALALYQAGNYRDAASELNRIDSYYSPSYRRLGLLYQGRSYVALQESQKAQEALSQFLAAERKDPLLRQMAYLSLGYAQEGVGRCPDAAGSFAEAEKLAGPFKEEALLGKARCSAQSGNYKEALNSYKQLLANFPASEKHAQATVAIHEIEGKIKDEQSK